MSSFWNLFGGKEGKPPDGEEENPSDEGEEPNTEAIAAAHAAAHAASVKGGSTSVAPKPQGQGQGQAQGQGPSSSIAPEQRGAAAMQPPQRTGPRYGIDDAMRLMRTLPVDENVDLVVRVIKRTLESLSVRVPDIIEDASRRQEALKGKISEHQTAIAQFEREIELRRYEINRLEDELAETTTTRDRLQLAEALPVTPMPTKVATTGGSGVPPSMPRKPDVVPASTAAPSAKAPPLPATTFRPKPAPAEASKRPPSPDAPPRINDDDEDDDQPVESRDLIDKS